MSPYADPKASASYINYDSNIKYLLSILDQTLVSPSIVYLSAINFLEQLRICFSIVQQFLSELVISKSKQQ